LSISAARGANQPRNLTHLHLLHSMNSPAERVLMRKNRNVKTS
jgi:hypothetical protein